MLCIYAQSCPTLCNPMDYSPPGSTVHGIFQARILERVAIFYLRLYSWPRVQTHISCVSCFGRWITLPLSHLRSPLCILGPNESNPRDRVFGEAEEDRFIALPGKGRHTWLLSKDLIVRKNIHTSKIKKFQNYF